MPIILAGKVEVYPIVNQPFSQNPAKQPLRFGTINVTQYLYLVFAGTFFFVLRKELYSRERIVKAIKISICLGIVSVLSGILHDILYLSNLSEMSLIFYRFMGAPDLSFTRKMLFKKIPQMYSFLGEPGWTALFLVFPLGFVGTKFFSRAKWLKGGTNTFSFFILITGLLISTSTTAYVGIILFLLSYLCLCAFKMSFHVYIRTLVKIAVALLISFFFVWLVFNAFFRYSFFEFFEKTQIAKVLLQHGSGPIRWHYAVENFKIFIKYPLLGVGIGSCRSTSLMTSILSNTGIFGTVTFLLFNFSLFRKIFKLYLMSDREEGLFYLALLATFLTLFTLMLIARSISALYFK
jgi:hypothetical protein